MNEWLRSNTLALLETASTWFRANLSGVIEFASALVTVALVALIVWLLRRVIFDFMLRAAGLELARAVGWLVVRLRAGWGAALLLGIDAVLVLEALERLLALPGQLRQPQNVVVVTLMLWLVFQALLARRRLVVQDFTDFTPDGKAPKGLATLLVAELARIGRVYQRVDEQAPLRPATSSGQTAARPVDATIVVEDIGETLKGAVSAEASVTLGIIKIPIGAILGVVANVVQGPRINASVHQEAGRFFLIAQLSRSARRFTWRVDLATQTAETTFDVLIRQLASRIFADMALGGRVRASAVASLTEGLGFYDDCLRTQKDYRLNLQRAERSFSRAIAADNTYHLVYYNLGVVYQLLNQFDASARAFGEAVTRDPDDWRPYYALAWLETKAQRQIRLAERVIALRAKTAEAWDLAGRALFELGENKAARRYRERAVRIAWADLRAALARGDDGVSPELARRRQVAGECAVNLALTYFEDALSSSGVQWWIAMRQAEGMLRQALDLTPSDRLAHANLVLVYRNWKRYRQAASAAERALRVAAEDPYMWAERALALAHEGPKRREIAREACIEVLTHLLPGPFQTGALEQAAGAAHLVDDDALADRLRDANKLLETLATGESMSEGRPKLDEAYARYGRPDADRVWERGLIGHAFGYLELQAGRPERAVEYLRAAVNDLASINPTGVRNMGTRALLADALAAQNQIAEAILEAQASVNPIGTYERKALAEIYFQAGDNARARDAWLDALVWSPEDADSYFRLALCEWNQFEDLQDAGARVKALTQAADYFTKARDLELNPEIAVQTVFWMARIRLELNDYPGAASLYRLTAGFGKLWPLPEFYVALCQLRSSFYDNSGAAFEALASAIEAKIDAGKSSVDNEIGSSVGESWRLGSLLALTRWGQAYGYALRGVRLDRVRELVAAARTKRSTLESPERTSICDQACLEVEGLVFLQEGWFDEAIVKFNEAIALSADPETMTHLADAYFQKAQVQPTPEGAKHFVTLAQRTHQRARDYDIGKHHTRELDLLAQSLASAST